MMFDNFNEYVKNFDNFKSKQALVIKPFLKVRRLNYGQLQDKVYQTANYLISQGIKKDDRVMIVAANCPEWIEVFLGCQLIGAIWSQLTPAILSKWLLNLLLEPSQK